MEGTLRFGESFQSIGTLPSAEELLSAQDPALGLIIAIQCDRWPEKPSEDPLWGLLRIVMAQQLSTVVACRLAERALHADPRLRRPSFESIPDVDSLRRIGLSESRARCCIDIVTRSDEFRRRANDGEDWAQILNGIKGIGPWTIQVFRIMVLREPDILPLKDIGLERAISKVYGPTADITELSENWRPYRSVACWYLWRTLGNMQLG